MTGIFFLKKVSVFLKFWEKWPKETNVQVECLVRGGYNIRYNMKNFDDLMRFPLPLPRMYHNQMGKFMTNVYVKNSITHFDDLSTWWLLFELLSNGKVNDQCLCT